jgi:hypothetical protein
MYLKSQLLILRTRGSIRKQISMYQQIKKKTNFLFFSNLWNHSESAFIQLVKISVTNSNLTHFKISAFYLKGCYRFLFKICETIYSQFWHGLVKIYVTNSNCTHFKILPFYLKWCYRMVTRYFLWSLVCYNCFLVFRWHALFSWLYTQNFIKRLVLGQSWKLSSIIRPIKWLDICHWPHYL